LFRSPRSAILPRCPTTLTTSSSSRPARPGEAIACALRYRGEKRVHQADECMAQIAAERIVEHLARARFVVMKKPPEIGGGALGRGFER
jgi:hypothetical protein